MQMLLALAAPVVTMERMHPNNLFVAAALLSVLQLTGLSLCAQAHKFLTGYAPIRSMARVGAAAGALLMIPAEQLKQGSQPRVNVPPVSRQVQRGLTRAPMPYILSQGCDDSEIREHCSAGADTSLPQGRWP